MSIKMRLHLLTLALLVLSTSLAIACEFKQCQHQCTQHSDRGQRLECERRCEDFFRHRGEYDYEDEANYVTDEERRCQEQCERRGGGGQEKALCRLRCQQRMSRGGEGREEWETDNPYVFDAEEFSPILKSQHGNAKILKRFGFKSDLLWHLKNYRIAFMEIDPQTFVTPAHVDSDIIFFVAKGRGVAGFLREDKQDNVELNEGDVAFLPSGTVWHLTNTDSNEKFVIIKLIRTVNSPGQFGVFNAQHGKQSESYYDAFSEDLLESVFKVQKEKLQQVLGRNHEVLVKASREQIQSLTRHEDAPRIWPFSKESIETFNLFRRVTHRNKYGQLFEATPEDVRQLREVDVAVSFANMTEGSVSGPFFNSRSTKVAFVLDGEGFVEIICPHKSGQSQREGTPVFRNIRSQIRRGSVFVVPAGHPVATVAPRDHLRVICFEINAQYNSKYQLTGKRNVFKNLEDTAKELTFGSPAREADQLLNKQNEDFFYPWLRKEQHHQRLDRE